MPVALGRRGMYVVIVVAVAIASGLDRSGVRGKGKHVALGRNQMGSYSKDVALGS